jgi:hypothetical protein
LSFLSDVNIFISKLCILQRFIVDIDLYQVTCAVHGPDLRVLLRFLPAPGSGQDLSQRLLSDQVTILLALFISSSLFFFPLSDFIPALGVSIDRTFASSVSSTHSVTSISLSVCVALFLVMYKQTGLNCYQGDISEPAGSIDCDCAVSPVQLTAGRRVRVLKEKRFQRRFRDSRVHALINRFHWRNK